MKQKKSEMNLGHEIEHYPIKNKEELSLFDKNILTHYFGRVNNYQHINMIP